MEKLKEKGEDSIISMIYLIESQFRSIDDEIQAAKSKLETLHANQAKEQHEAMITAQFKRYGTLLNELLLPQMKSVDDM